LTGIESQIELLKSNSIKMILGSIVLNMALGVSTFEGMDFNALGINCNELGIAPPSGNTNLINFLIEVSNKVEGNSEEVFRDLMYRVIDHSGKNIFTRIYAKIECSCVFGLILDLVGNLFDNLKKILVNFANLPPAKQLEEITHLLINPLLDHLSAVDGQPANQAIVSKTPDQILKLFIKEFLTQFIDKKYQHWTRTYRAICIDKAASSGLIAKVFYITSSFLLWVAGKISAPFHYAINKTIHGVLKKVIVGLCPALSEATKDSLEIGTDNAWFSVKNSLLQTFRQARLTGLRPRAEDPIYQPSKEVPAEVKEKLTTALDKLFKVLAIPDESKPAHPTLSSAVKLLRRNPSDEEFGDFLKGDGKALIPLLQENMHGNLSSLKDIIRNSVADLLLDMFAQDNCINGTLLSSLTSTNASGFASTIAPPISSAEKEKVNAELQQEFGLLGGSILRSVSNATRTDRSNQTYANIHITALQQQVQAFNQTLLQIEKNKDLSFKKSALVACKRFNTAMKKFEAEITQTVDASTKALLMPHLNKARNRVLKIGENLSELCPIEVKRRHVEAKLDELSPLLAIPLANQAEISTLIEELRSLDASFLDVEGLVNDLYEYHQIYLRQLATATLAPDTQPFIRVVNDYKDRANTAAKVQIKQLKPWSIESAARLAAWADKLKFVKVTIKLTPKDAAMAALYNLPAVKAIASAAIQAYGKNLFTFIGDEKNLGGIAQHIMEAYLSKPPMMTKKHRPKVGFYDAFHKKAKIQSARPLTGKEQKKLAENGWVIV